MLFCRAVHHGGVSPADAAGSGSGVLSEDAERPQSRRAVLYLPEPAPGLRTARSVVTHVRLGFGRV